VSDLREQAPDFCECPVVPCKPPESGVEVVVNWAFLLPKGSTAAFRARIDRLNAEHGPQGLILNYQDLGLPIASSLRYRWSARMSHLLYCILALPRARTSGYLRASSGSRCMLWLTMV